MTQQHPLASALGLHDVAVTRVCLKEAEKTEASEVCYICHLLLAPGDPVVTGVCGHSFHEKCMRAWSENGAGGVSRCPYCSRPWRKVDPNEKAEQQGASEKME